MQNQPCPRCGEPLHPSTDGSPAFCRRCTPPPDASAETKTSAEQGPAPPPQSYSGRTFGNYTIVEEISRGAMGVVYKARQHHLNRIVALKVLIAGDLATETQIARFRREAQAAARLRHPAIVPIYEVGVHEGRNFYTMDYIEGENLSVLVHAGTITTRRALDITAELADAFAYAHDQDVIHRDIKPSNIMIDNQGGVHILDFGLAKQLDSDTRFTRTGTTIGTPAYMPPEQASGESRRVDHRADVYSLGAVLYEMLTGRAPFTGDTMMNTLMKVLNDDPMPPKRLNPRIHRDIQTIVLKAMEKRQERRYPTMGALADDIRRFIAGESISARPAGLLYRTWRLIRRHQSAAFAVLAVLTMGFTTYAIIQQLQRDSRLKEQQAFRSGRAQGEKEAEQERQRQERPTVKTVFADDFDRADLDQRWVLAPNGKPWVQNPAGYLDVAASRLTSVHTKATFSGKVAVQFDAVLPPASEGPPQSAPQIGCFLGSNWQRSYRVTLGGTPSRLVLRNLREEVAELACPPLQLGVPYTLTLRRTDLGLLVTVDAPEAGLHRELGYNDIALPISLDRKFAAGLFTERTHMRVERFRVEQEFPPLKTTSLEAAEALLRKGNLDEAQERYNEIREAYRGRYEGLASALGIARCHIISGRYDRALPLLRDIEDLAPKLAGAGIPELLTTARFYDFLSSTSLNHFAEAAQALVRIAESHGIVSPAWIWHVPRRLNDLVGNRAYDETLQILGCRLFGDEHATIHDTVVAIDAPALFRTLASSVRRLADGFGDNGQPEKLMATFVACPIPALSSSFARAVDVASRNGKTEDALSLLTFCTDNALVAPPLKKSMLAFASSLCQSGKAARLPELHAAYPDPDLLPFFVQGVGAKISAGELADANRLFETGLATFPERADAFVPSAAALGRAFVEGGELLKPIALHKALGGVDVDPSFITLFASAADRAIGSGRPADAVRLLDHARRQFGIEHPKLADAALRLFQLHVRAGDYDRAGTVYATYPNSTLAPLLASAIGDAAADHLDDALTLFALYARDRYPVPEDAARRLATSLAVLDPADDIAEALLERYRDVYEAYDNPSARTALTLALGDAYVRAGRLPEARSQYVLSGDPQGLLRAACLATERQDMAQAAAAWQALSAASDTEPALASAAGLMLSTVPEATFREAAKSGKLPTQLVHYILGLRLWLEGSPDAASHFAQAKGDPPAWFTPLAGRERPTTGTDPIP